MDDREIVAAITAGDPVGVAGAYDKYAASLYGYCRWMLAEPADAAEALQRTFIIAAATKLGGLRDPGQLRPSLYAVARDECYNRLHATEPGLGQLADIPARPPNAPEPTAAERRDAEVRRTIRATMAELNPRERELIELSLRHDLNDADLAVVLDVSWNRAHALAERARHHLEKALAVLVIARTGRQHGPHPGRAAPRGAVPAAAAARAPPRAADADAGGGGRRHSEDREPPGHRGHAAGRAARRADGPAAGRAAAGRAGGRCAGGRCAGAGRAGGGCAAESAAERCAAAG